MDTINQIQDQIIEDFSMFEDWNDKYEYIIESGKSLAVLNEQFKTEENIIKGCQSKVWLNAFMKEGKLYFEADSDAIITKGIISLLVKVLSGQTPKEIIDTNLYFIKDIGLQEHLSPNRANGLVSMVKQMKMYAFTYDQVN
jgi:cysteine desulfuration protein SufE